MYPTDRGSAAQTTQCDVAGARAGRDEDEEEGESYIHTALNTTKF